MDPPASDKYLPTTEKSCNGEIRTDFLDKGLPQKETGCTRYAIKLINSVYKCEKRYYH